MAVSNEIFVILFLIVLNRFTIYRVSEFFGGIVMLGIAFSLYQYSINNFTLTICSFMLFAMSVINIVHGLLGSKKRRK